MNYNRERNATSAMTLLEVMVALAICLIVLGGIAMLNSQILLLVRSQKQEVAAASVLQQRMEVIRNTGWEALRSPSEINSILNQQVNTPTGLRILPESRERLQVETFTVPGYTRTPTGTTSYTITLRNASQDSSGINSFAPLDESVEIVRALVALEWDSSSRRRQLSHSTLIYKKGVGK